MRGEHRLTFIISMAHYCMFEYTNRDTSGKDKHVFPLLASCVPSDAATQNVSGGQQAKLLPAAANSLYLVCPHYQ